MNLQPERINYCCSREVFNDSYSGKETEIERKRWREEKGGSIAHSPNYLGFAPD